ncbi:MAG: type II secretion system inner membrane protein GspF [Deltaproteobacteria bacterium]|nr:type II secretion system inner membrane protein GspF [Deltaproteobacteria bacterium]
MPLFEYKGYSHKGTAIKGKIDADTEKNARAKLRRQNIFPTEIIERTVFAQTQKKTKGLKLQIGGRIKLMDIVTMTKQFATLVGAHIPIVETLTALSRQVENERLRIVLTDIKEKVNAGQSLAKALALHPKVFSKIYINMVQVGEASGTLDIVMARLADFTEAQMKLKNKITSAMAYPAIMVLAAMGLFVLIFTFVLPNIMALFEGSEVTLPLITTLSIDFGNFVIGNWYLVTGGLFLLFIIFKRYIKTEKGLKHYHRFLLRAPIFGKLIQMIAISRFTRTLGTLLSSGVPLLTSMDIVKNIVNNIMITEALEKARTAIQEGKSIARPLEESEYFPPMVVHMISVGEKTGELEKMLNTVANTYDTEVETHIETMTSLLTPVMTIFMAAMVLFLMVAIILPAMDLMQTVT